MKTCYLILFFSISICFNSLCQTHEYEKVTSGVTPSYFIRKVYPSGTQDLAVILDIIY